MAIDAGEVAQAGGWVSSLEGELVARAMGKPQPPHALSEREAQAALAALASKFLAVGTPRTYGLIGAGASARGLLAAQCSYAAPRELRVCEVDDARAVTIAGELGSATLQARAVPLSLACACDIVVVAAPVAIRREWIRAGTLVTVLDGGASLDRALLGAAHVHTLDDRSTPPAGVRVYATLAAVAAGLVDGRSLDELIVVLA